ncbi:hypothetical protein KC19_9G167700 [Ceratodon purpureus]|uniref:Uncharacterized protein n=1 Tax=Ceratodon purpureus TaxID=3225 RepID=A0A8T0GUZ1_CERPU|nr:hypothetical protein KC19_9G167700 [Ceratodon purpureus]
MKMKAAAPAALALLVVMAMMEGSAQAAACPSQFPLTCASYVLDSRSVPLKTCSIELVQDNFQLLKPTSSLKSFCEAIKGVKLYNGPLTGTQLNLALGLPEKCALSGQYKKGQSCNGAVRLVEFRNIESFSRPTWLSPSASNQFDRESRYFHYRITL